jgi:hypothetical protein
MNKSNPNESFSSPTEQTTSSSENITSTQETEISATTSEKLTTNNEKITSPPEIESSPIASEETTSPPETSSSPSKASNQINENLISTITTKTFVPPEKQATPTKKKPTFSVNQPKSNMSIEQKVDRLGKFSLNILRSIALWRLVGYTLLFLFVMDLAEIFIPPHFLDPQWEFNALGQLVERVPIPFISFILIFYGGNYLRKGWENLFLKFASWLTLMMGILLILAVPLGITNTIRIDQQTQANIMNKTNERLQVLEAVEDRLAQVTNREEMQVLIAQLNRGNAPVLKNEAQLKEAKSNLSQFIEDSREQLKNEANFTKKQARNSLLKRSVKWNVGSLVSGILFVIFWNMSKWARDNNYSD